MSLKSGYNLPNEPTEIERGFDYLFVLTRPFNIADRSVSASMGDSQ
jgi:hypothetical protein